MIKDFFNNSASQFASFFTNETNLSVQELEELKTDEAKELKDQVKSILNSVQELLDQKDGKSE